MPLVYNTDKLHVLLKSVAIIKNDLSVRTDKLKLDTTFILDIFTVLFRSN